MVDTGPGRLRWRPFAVAVGPSRPRLTTFPKLRAEVEARLNLEWSPQQISASLKQDFPGQPEMQISDETIYLCLYIQSRGVLKKELTSHVRKQRMVRQAKKHLSGDRYRRSDRVMISERPAEVADRAVPGHWEGAYCGKSQSARAALS